MSAQAALHREFATSIAIEVGNRLRMAHLQPVKSWNKDDLTPVTALDLEIDSFHERFPAHHLISEESGDSGNAASDWVWLCDPIDGTIAFSRGYAQFTFALALTYKGESVLGVVSDPIHQLLYVGESGKGATVNGNKLDIAQQIHTDNAVIDLEIHHNDLLIDSQMRGSLRSRGFKVITLSSGSFASASVARGGLTGIVYGHTSPWDAGALDVIIRESGGRVTDLDGLPLDFRKPVNGFIGSANSVHSDLRDCADLSRNRS